MKTGFLQFALMVVCAVLLPGSAFAFADGRFANSDDKGFFGEDITRESMDARGYTTLDAKVQGNHGLDHVFVKYNTDGTVKEICLCETKTDTSRLVSDQMSDEWIDKQIKRMKADPDPNVRKTGELLEKHRKLVKKELWHHDTRTGKTTVSELGPDGKPTQVKAEFSTKRQQRKLLEAREKAKQLELAKAKSAPEGPARSRLASVEEKAPPRLHAQEPTFVAKPVDVPGSKQPRVKWEKPTTMPDHLPPLRRGALASTSRMISDEGLALTTRAVSAGEKGAEGTAFVLSKIGRSVVKIAVPVAVAVEIATRGCSVYRTEEDYEAGKIDWRERGKSHSSNAGGGIGGTAGAYVGGVAGSLFGIPGTIVGVIVVGAAGDYIGSKVGEVVWLLALGPIEEGRLRDQHHLTSFYARTGTLALDPDDLKRAGFSEIECKAYTACLKAAQISP